MFNLKILSESIDVIKEISKRDLYFVIVIFF